jgi:K+-sensing histidine kinase KdpD
MAPLPIPAIDRYFLLARWAVIILGALLVLSLRPGDPFSVGHVRVHLFDSVTLLPLYLLCDAALSLVIWYKLPLSTGQGGWALFAVVLLAFGFYAATGGVGSMYFVPFVLGAIHTAVALRTDVGLVFVVVLTALLVFVGRLLVSPASWDADMAKVAFAEASVLFVLSGIGVFFASRIRSVEESYQATRSEADRNAALNAISLRLAEHNPDLKRVLDTILESAYYLSHTAFVVVLLRDPSAQEVSVAASNSAHHPLGEKTPLIDWQVDTRRAHGTGAGYDTPLVPFFAADGVPQVIAVFLRLPAGNVLGTICYGRQTDQPLHADEQVYLQGLAAEAGLAIRNARLYAREQEQVERLRRFQELQATYFSALAHEMKTPLTVLKMLAPSLRQLPDLPERTRGEILEAIEGNLVRLEWSINGPLESARLEAGTLALRLRPLDLVHHIQQVVAHISPWLELKRQQVHIQADPDLRLVLADSSLIDHVITNLLVNAIKFAPGGTAIEMSLQVVAGAMHVCVEDQGPGVPADKRTRIFDKFYAAGAGQGAGGAGLGLYLCRELVQMHGGRIWVEERPGGGSRFCFTLPIVGEEVGNEGRQSQDSSHRRRTGDHPGGAADDYPAGAGVAGDRRA